MLRKADIHNLIQNIPFIISGMAVAVLYPATMSRFWLSVMMFGMLVIASLYLKNVYAYWKSHVSVFVLFISFCILFIFGHCFYSLMIFNSKFQALSSFTGLSVNAIAALATLAGIIVGIYFLSTVISAVYSIVLLNPREWRNSQPSAKQTTAISGRQFAFILVTATIAVTICSKSSPIYPFNDWVDSNCFMTIGKSMLHGLVPYRDLYDHKGPLLYMIHAIAALVSDTTFLGVYFLEIIEATFFLFFSFKTMKLYQPSVSILLVPILAAVVYSAHSFYFGDSAEELCLPLFSFAVYLAVRLIRHGKLPRWWEFMAVGVTSSFVLWIKFSMLGFYVGWFCVIVWQLIRCKSVKKLFRISLWIGTGVLIPTVPILIYIGINHAFTDLWTVYFYNNLFSYSNVSHHSFIFSLAINLFKGMESALVVNLIFITALLGTGLLALRKKADRTEYHAYLMMGISTFLLIYIGGRVYPYYSFIFCAFAPVGVLAVCQTLQVHLFARYQTANVFRGIRRFAGGIICAGSFSLAFVMCSNTYLLSYSKSDLPQYQFAEIITQKENATLLNYGFLDGGFYMTTGIVPNCRFFCDLNFKGTKIMEAQNEYVERGQVDFVITQDTELESKQYACIATSTFYLEGAERKYFLYQRIT